MGRGYAKMYFKATTTDGLCWRCREKQAIVFEDLMTNPDSRSRKIEIEKYVDLGFNLIASF